MGQQTRGPKLFGARIEGIGGNAAYTVVDVTGSIPDDTAEKLNAINGVSRVRIID